MGIVSGKRGRRKENRLVAQGRKASPLKGKAHEREGEEAGFTGKNEKGELFRFWRLKKKIGAKSFVRGKRHLKGKKRDGVYQEEKKDAHDLPVERKAREPPTSEKEVEKRVLHDEPGHGKRGRKLLTSMS